MKKECINYIKPECEISTVISEGILCYSSDIEYYGYEEYEEIFM